LATEHLQTRAVAVAAVEVDNGVAGAPLLLFPQ